MSAEGEREKESVAGFGFEFSGLALTCRSIFQERELSAERERGNEGFAGVGGWVWLR